MWIQNEARIHGKVIADDAIGKLLEMVGPNMLQLQMEVEKMALYLGEDSNITIDLVEDFERIGKILLESKTKKYLTNIS